MSPEDIKTMRISMGWRQRDLGELLGVSTAFICRWERGNREPSPHDSRILKAFQRASERDPNVGEVVLQMLKDDHLISALLVLFSASQS